MEKNKETMLLVSLRYYVLNLWYYTVWDYSFVQKKYSRSAVGMIPIPTGADGLSPPPYCKCHRFIFYPYVTDPLFCRVMTNSPTAALSEISSSSSDYEQNFETTFNVATDEPNQKRKLKIRMSLCSNFALKLILTDIVYVTLMNSWFNHCSYFPYIDINIEEQWPSPPFRHLTSISYKGGVHMIFTFLTFYFSLVPQCF